MGDLDTIASVISASWHKAPKAHATPTGVERGRAARTTPIGSEGPFFRFTPAQSVCCVCGGNVPPPIVASRPLYMPKVLFAAYCVKCVKSASG